MNKWVGALTSTSLCLSLCLSNKYFQMFLSENLAPIIARILLPYARTPTDFYKDAQKCLVTRLPTVIFRSTYQQKCCKFSVISVSKPERENAV